MLAMPDTVSIVTGNQTASAIRPTAENDRRMGEMTIASGTRRWRESGRSTFSTGMPQ